MNISEETKTPNHDSSVPESLSLGRGFDMCPGLIGAAANPDDCIHRRFEQQAARTPESEAILYEGESWTYEKLNRHANQLAAHLKELGVGPDQLVGVHMDRSPWLIAGMLGVLKAGGAYVPMDPAFPHDRLQMIAEDARIKVLVTESGLADRLEIPEVASVLFGADSEFVGPHEMTTSESGLRSDHLAYVIFTSGSTGRPKGVEIRHRSAVNLLLAMAEEPGFGPGDSWMAITTISFDISVAEIFVPLITGGRIVLAPPGVGADGEAFAAMLEAHEITLVQCTPTTLRIVLAAGWQGKQDLKIVIGGEAVDRDLAGKLLPICGELWNFYGPTETTVWSTCLKMEHRDGPVVVGRALPGNAIYLLDGELKPVAAGASGEICIGGDSVARGYANRPDLTAEKFVPDPFSEKPGALLYRTGDLGRWHEDGMLECQGRMDNQVKVRGYRIELGEIEAALKDHPSVHDSVVVVQEPVPGDQRLVGHIIPDGDAPSREDLLDHLQGHLPSYMVPSSFHMMEAFPMTPNLKIDRKALARQTPAPQVATARQTESSAAEFIASLWRDVLGMHEIPIDGNVFRLGAHSMHVARVHAGLKQHFEKRITAAHIFQHPTPRSLAAYLDEDSPQGRQGPVARGKAAGKTRDIAIIGLSARFAGARNVDQYWRNIRDGVESIRDFSEEELRAKGVPSDLLENKRYVRRGCVLADHDCFDAGFFEMSPREAELTNPQHRVFLQAAWETLEHAGYVPESFDGSIGLFAGSGHNSYQPSHQGLSGPEYLQHLVGNEQDYLTTRTAFKLGLNGPAINIQTACSTSLVAIHAACQSLLDGDCDMALAGGVSISWPEGQGYLSGEGLIYSPDGICRAFDAKAAGTVFSHGVGLVALKPLDRAVADGDTIHAVIRGIAINNDGTRKGSFASPSIEGQAEVITAALAQQEIHPESIGLMEAHGTGTAVGDPIEIAGLTQAFRQWTGRKQFCALGSVKTNIGHSDAAAGVAGLIKAVLALKHRQLPPLLNFETPNPDLDIDHSPFRIQTELAPWPGEIPRRAAVSSFGLGGTNAHAILEEYPAQVSAGISRRFQILPFSAKTRESFDRHAGRWSDFLTDNPDINLSDAAFTMQTGRAAFGKRGFLVSDSTHDLQEQLESGKLRSRPAKVMDREVVFLFSGQGSQYTGMARSTYFNEPVFSRELDRCSEILEPYLGIRLIEALYPDDGSEAPDLNQTSLAQPALFAISYAQARLWMSWGVEPACMLGHSIGEYVAAVLGGVFSLEDGLKLIAGRGRLMQSMEAGSMLAVMQPEAEVMKLIIPHPRLDLAASNAPDLCVVAGPRDAIAAFTDELEAGEIACRALRTSHAFHSHMMDCMLGEFEVLVSGVTRNEPAIPYLSNVTGNWITPAEACDPKYYSQHIRQTVRFSEAALCLMENPKRLFLEMGPGRTLAALIGKHIEDASTTISLPTIPAAQDDTPSSRHLMEALGKAWSSGLRIDWKKLHTGESKRRIPLPTYPFEEKRYWLDQSITHKSQPDGLAKRADPSDWFLNPGWRQQPAHVTHREQAENRTWLILGELPAELEKGIFARGDSFTQFRTPDSAGLSDCFTKPEKTPDQILVSWTLDQGEFEPLSKSVDLGRARSVETIHNLIHARSAVPVRKPLTIHFLTRNFHDVLGGEPAQPQWSFLIGSCLVVTQEFNDIRCRQLDVDRIDGRTVAAILDECLHPDEEPAVAWRRGRRWVRDYAPVFMGDLPAGQGGMLRESGVYLITGGLGRVGQLFAEHLVRKAGAKIVLLGRNGLPERDGWESLVKAESTTPELAEKLRKLLEIEALGGEVTTIAADVGSRRDIAAAIAETKARYGAIHGIIHAAGVVSSQSILDGKPEDLKDLTHAKTEGAMAIYQEAGNLNLDFCLLTSSLSSVLGGHGYHAYAAGNAFLDHFARWANQTSDFPWISVNWDAWKFPADKSGGLGGGMRRLAMTPEESLIVLDRILAHPEAGRNGWVVSTAPLAARLEQWVRKPARCEAKPLAVAKPASPGETPIARMLEIWKACFRRDVSADDDYFDLGGDSLMAVGLFTKIEDEFDQALPLSSLINSPTPAALVSLLIEDEAPAPVIEATESATSSDDHVIAIRETGNLRPLFCIHGGDGGVMFYRDFAMQLDEDRPFYAVEAPMLRNLDLTTGESIPAIASSYIKDIRRIQPEGPYLLGGYSFGGLVAFEMARQLRSEGVGTTRLLLFDTPNPASPVRNFTLPERISVQWNLHRDKSAIRKVGMLAKRIVSGAVFRVNYELEKKFAEKADAAEGDHLRHVQARERHEVLFNDYKPEPYDGATCLFIAKAGGGDKFAYQENLGWNGTLVGDLQIARVPGSHLEIFSEPNLTPLLKAARPLIPKDA